MNAALSIPPLSQSRHERLACPSSYVWSEVYGYPQTDNEDSILGNEIHAILFNWAAHNSNIKSRVTDQIHLEEVLRVSSFEAGEIIRHFLDNFSLPFNKIVALEKRLEGGDDIEGTPDAILKLAPGHYHIYDYKNYYRIIKADTFQSKLYPVLVFLNYPDAKRVDFTLAFTRYGCTRMVSYTRADMPALMELVQASRTRQLAMHADPQQYEKDAVPGEVCIYCPLLRMRECPIDGRNPMEMSTSDRVLWQIYLKRAATANDEVLKGLAMRERLTAVSGGKKLTAGFVVKESRQYPMGEALVLLNSWRETTEGQDDLIADLHISKSALEAKLKAKKRCVLNQAFDDIAQVEKRTEFEITEEA